MTKPGVPGWSMMVKDAVPNEAMVGGDRDSCTAPCIPRACEPRDPEPRDPDPAEITEAVLPPTMLRAAAIRPAPLARDGGDDRDRPGPTEPELALAANVGGFQI